MKIQTETEIGIYTLDNYQELNNELKKIILEFRKKYPESDNSSVKAWHTHFDTHHKEPKFKILIDKIMDARPMPTIFLTSEIEKAIENKDDSNLFLLILLSINQKDWNEIHPEHLKLILQGIKEYKNSKLLKSVLIDIFKNVKDF